MTKIYCGRRGLNEEQLNTIEGSTVEFELEVHPGWGSTYVAELTKGSHLKGVDRDFLIADSKKLSRAGNGVLWYQVALNKDKATYFETESVKRSYETKKEYWKIADGELSYFDSLTELLADIHGFDSVKEYKTALKEQEEEKKKEAQENGFADLEGSPKQISWALDIRAKKLAKASEDAEIKKLKNETSAKWFIDNRF